MLENIAVCAFDAYGTLFNLQAMAEVARSRLGERADAFNGLWRQKQLEYTWLRSLMGEHADFWQVTGEALDYAMAALQVEDGALRGALMAAYLTPTAYPEVIATLTALKQSGRRLAILSNGTPKMLARAAEAAGLDSLLDAVLSVEEVGVYKPQPAVYRLVEQRFACPSKAVAFMSSNGWDAAGAAAHGFQVAWINRTGLPAETLPFPPRLTLSSLAELPALIG